MFVVDCRKIFPDVPHRICQPMLWLVWLWNVAQFQYYFPATNRKLTLWLADSWECVALKSIESTANLPFYSCNWNFKQFYTQFYSLLFNFITKNIVFAIHHSKWFDIWPSLNKLLWFSNSSLIFQNTFISWIILISSIFLLKKFQIFPLN